MEPHVELSGKVLAAVVGRLTRGMTAKLLRGFAGTNLTEGDRVSVTYELLVTGFTGGSQRQIELTDTHGERHLIDL